jgi:hypothetical protein
MPNMPSALTEVLGRGVVIVVVTTALATFRKWMPASAIRIGGEMSDTGDLEQRFMPLRGRVIGAMIAIGVMFALGSWYLLSRTNMFLARLDGPADFILLPQPSIWWFFPCFGALCLCWEITLQIWSLFEDRETLNLFSDWTNQSPTFWGSYYGMDSRKILRWMTVLIALPILVFTMLALNMHAIVSSKQIRDCGYGFKPCAVYQIADVRRITEVEGFRTTDGKLTRRAGVVFDFADGRRWSSANWGDFKRTVDPSFLSYVQQVSGLSIGTATSEADIPPLNASPKR